MTRSLTPRWRRVVSAALFRATRMPVPVSTKIFGGLGVVSGLALLAMTAIYNGMRSVERDIQVLADVEQPLSAAAYEMEINIHGVGFAVLNYLDSAEPRDRALVIDDRGDFERFWALYGTLVTTEPEKQLGATLGERFAQFSQLGESLMDKRDQQQALFVALNDVLEAIGEAVSARTDPAVSGRRTSDLEYSRAVALLTIQSEVVELGFWISDYRRARERQYRERVLAKMNVMQATLERFTRLADSRDDQGLAAEVRVLLGRTMELTEQVAVLVDELNFQSREFDALRTELDGLLDEGIQPLALETLRAPRRTAGQTTGSVVRFMQWVIPLFLIVAGLVGAFQYGSVTRPLRRLMRGIEGVGQEGLSHRLRGTPRDEFGDVAVRFNRMLEELQEGAKIKERLPVAERELQQAMHELEVETNERERAEQRGKEMELELGRQQMMSVMGAIVAGVAHEVRNPLFGISSTLDAMQARLEGRVEYQRYVEVLRGQVDRLQKLMVDLLEYGKPQVPERVVAPLQPLVESAMLAMLPLAQTAGVRIELDVDQRLAKVLIDQRRFFLVIRNLIENALFHTPQGGSVNVALRLEGDAREGWAVFVVRDTGAGFRAEDLPHIFEPFFSRRRGGTGLGLSIVQRIVEEHGGSVAAANAPEGGAAVTVRLPVGAHGAEGS